MGTLAAPRPPTYSHDAALLHASAMKAARIAAYLRAQASLAVYDAAARRPAGLQRRAALVVAAMVDELDVTL